MSSQFNLSALQQVLVTICPHKLDGRPVVNVHTDEHSQGSLADFQRLLAKGFRVVQWEPLIPGGVATDGRCHLLFTIQRTEGQPAESQELMILGTYRRPVDGMSGVSVITYEAEDSTLRLLNHKRSTHVLIRQEHFGVPGANAYGYTVFLLGLPADCPPSQSSNALN